MSTRHLPPERRSEIARNAALANKSKGRGFKPCRNAPDGPHLVPVEGCRRCRLRESEKRSRSAKNATAAAMSIYCEIHGVAVVDGNFEVTK